MRFEKVGPNEWHGVPDSPPPQKPWYSDAMEAAHRRTLIESERGEEEPKSESQIRAEHLKRFREQQAKHGIKPLSMDEAMIKLAKSKTLAGTGSQQRAVNYLVRKAQSGDSSQQNRIDDILIGIVNRKDGTKEAEEYVSSLTDGPTSPLLQTGGKNKRRRKRSTKRKKTRTRKRRKTKRK